MSEKSQFVVSAEWLEEHLNDPGLIIIDGSWYLPAQNRDARAEYDEAHIPGAIFFNHDTVVDPDSDLPHSIPPAAIFAEHASAMGISKTDTIVVYDGPGMFTAPRVWWLFRVFGADKVLILDGGFDRWKEAGRPITNEPTQFAANAFHANYDDGQVVKLHGMMGLVGSGKGQIADARSGGRFSGEEPEPREGMRSGHMPGAINLPFSELVEDGHLKDLDTLKQIVTDRGFDLTKPIVTTCGSGVTAAVINLALSSLGREDSRLYDGSWSEWGGRSDTAVVKGDEE